MQKTTVDYLVSRRLLKGSEISRKSIEIAQLHALRTTLQKAKKSPFYREKYSDIHLSDINSMNDLHKLPFLNQNDIAKEGSRLLSISQSQVARIITLQTSGSTGTPKRFYFTRNDLASTMEFFLQGMFSLISTEDRVLVLLPYQAEASVGELLITALKGGNVIATGMWPPESGKPLLETIREKRITCVVGLPQHLLQISTVIEKGQLKSMLLCSDYASPALRKQIEDTCGCETFLHYGATESGLGGAVECSAHDGCHIRESDLLVEIIDPDTLKPLTDQKFGEVVLTTLNREGQILIRYRTGDIAQLDRSICKCGGVTSRIKNIRGRLLGVTLKSGSQLFSQDIDDILFQIPGLIDYRLCIHHDKKDILDLHYVAKKPTKTFTNCLKESLGALPLIHYELANKTLQLGNFKHVTDFATEHTLKRTILDKRSKGDINAPRT